MAIATVKSKGRKESDQVTLGEFEQTTADELAQEEARRKAVHDAALDTLKGMMPALADDRPVDAGKLREALSALEWDTTQLLGYVAKYRDMLRHQAEFDRYDTNALTAEIRGWCDEFARKEREHRDRLAERRGLIALATAEGTAASMLRHELRCLGLLS